MKQIDKKASARYSIPEIILMENAAFASLTVITDSYDFSSAVVFCGSGNNGGDGLALARMLHNRNCDVSVVIVSDEKSLKNSAKINFEIVRKSGIEIITKLNTVNLKKTINSSDIIIDAIFGTGFHGEIEKPLLNIFKMINSSKKPVISLDIPSGIDADSGHCAKDALKAEITVTFGAVKTGMLWNESVSLCGELFVADISIPKNLIIENNPYYILDREILTLMAGSKKNEWVHKSQKGRLLVIGGADGMEGAPQLAAFAGLKSGAGISYVKIIGENYKKYYPELVYTDNLKDALNKSNTIVAGCGMGTDKNSADAFMKTISDNSKNYVIDADGLNIISKMTEHSKRKCLADKIITPHPEEFYRLSQMRFSNIQEKIQQAELFAKKYKTLLVLKSPPTVITDGITTFIFPNMNKILATAGSGDVLAGIIGGFLSAGYDRFASALFGVYTHFYAGALLKKQNATASDILKNIPIALEELSHE